MQAYLRSIQRFALILLWPLPAYAVSGATKIVHIGYQKSGFLLLVRLEHALEKRLEPLGYSVEWHEFTSGPPLFEAINSAPWTSDTAGSLRRCLRRKMGCPLFTSPPRNRALPVQGCSFPRTRLSRRWRT